MCGGVEGGCVTCVMCWWRLIGCVQAQLASLEELGKVHEADVKWMADAKAELEALQVRGGRLMGGVSC